ncbi:MAG TPA: hypothetical protein VHW06_02825 [Streptosporangiaceae bacterium]|jgi:hypothetical protein|nr:hypothetical protein [Streptosporangiaceae bacterium]
MKRHSAHLDADVLAELSAGLISGKRATRIHAHLAGCQQCARLSAGLTEVRSVLASVSSPAMPEQVTRRLTTALAQEAAERSARATPAATARPSASPADDGAPARVLSFRGPPKSQRRGLTSPVAARTLTAAAAVCLVAAGGYAAVELTSSGSSPSPSGHSAAGARPHASASTGSAALPFIGQPLPGGDHGSDVLSFRVINSGTDYRTATLSTQISTELGQGVANSPDRSSGALSLHAPSGQQYGCVIDVTGGTEPALVDSASYNGHPATIIALAHVGHQVSQAWVVGPACSADNTDILAHVTLPTSGG